MTIQSVSFLGAQQVTRRPKHRPQGTPNVNSKPDTFEKNNVGYNREAFTTELQSYKDKGGKQKYSNGHIISILSNIDREPKRYASIKENSS